MGALNEPIRRPLTLDVSGLPSVAFGHRNTTWLANVFYMAIEGMMFALMFATYFYLRTRSTNWPPGHLPPALKYGAANAVIFLLSIIPAWIVRKRAPEGNRRAVRNGLLVLTLFALAATVLRVFEFSCPELSMDRRRLLIHRVGSDWNAFGASGDGVDRNASSAGYFVHSKDGRNAPRRCRDQFRLLVFRGGHGFDC